MNNGRFVFRAWPSKQPRPLLTSSVSEVNSDSKTYTRKAHRKSRGGCVACKKRRKKCDEARPSCSRCLDNKLDCNYVESQQAQSQSYHARANSSSLSRQLCPVARSPPVLTVSDHTQSTSQDFFLLSHFIQRSGALILGPDYSNVFTTQALEIALEVPFLMHAMLALSACELLHTVADARPYRLPEALHAQYASQGLRQAVGHMKSAKDMDAVFTSAMLLNCLALCYADWRDDEPGPQRSTPSWQWLRIQLGIKDLIIETVPFHQDSIWLPMFVATNTFKITEPPHSDLDVRLADYCNITSESSEASDVYFEFYEQIAPLVVRPAQFRYLRKYSNAIGGLNYFFLELLEQGDAKAMMLFVHWLGLMCTFVHWTTRRIRRECWLICRILDQELVGNDRSLLEKPAMACGYPLDLVKPNWPFYDAPRSASQEKVMSPV